MSAFKFLIDTNIVIGLEDNRPVEAGLTDLTRRCSANGVRLFVDAAVDEDVQRDADLARRAVTLSKLEKFERLKSIVYPDDAELARRYGPINSVNDRSDCRFLLCLERKAADFLDHSRFGLRRRAAWDSRQGALGRGCPSLAPTDLRAGGGKAALRGGARGLRCR